MGFLSSLNPFGSNSDTRTSSNATAYTNQTSQADNRVVLGNGATQLGQFARQDVDSNNITTVYGTDGGSVEIARLNAQLLNAFSSEQGDTVRALAKMGADGIAMQAGSATNLFATAAENNVKSWTHTVDQSADVIDKLLSSAGATITGAQTVARDAIGATQPVEGKLADSLKYALIAGALLVGFVMLKKA